VLVLPGGKASWAFCGIQCRDGCEPKRGNRSIRLGCVRGSGPGRALLGCYRSGPLVRSRGPGRGDKTAPVWCSQQQQSKEPRQSTGGEPWRFLQIIVHPGQFESSKHPVPRATARWGHPGQSEATTSSCSGFGPNKEKKRKKTGTLSPPYSVGRMGPARPLPLPRAVFEANFSPQTNAEPQMNPLTEPRRWAHVSRCMHAWELNGTKKTGPPEMETRSKLDPTHRLTRPAPLPRAPKPSARPGIKEPTTTPHDPNRINQPEPSKLAGPDQHTRHLLTIGRAP